MSDVSVFERVCSGQKPQTGQILAETDKTMPSMPEYDETIVVILFSDDSEVSEETGIADVSGAWDELQCSDQYYIEYELDGCEEYEEYDESDEMYISDDYTMLGDSDLTNEWA